MLPRWHVISGILITIVFFFIYPEIEYYNLALLFLASIFIDIDHYLAAVYRTGSWKLKSALKYYNDFIVKGNKLLKKGMITKEPFHPLHTLEVHVAVLILSIYWTPAIFIFYGMTFHSLLDIIEMIRQKCLPAREFFLSAWLIKKLY